jgi:methionine synthase II (cobalamin-independent)
VFATLTGPLPRPSDGDLAGAIRAVVAAQVDAGLVPVTDGHLRLGDPFAHAADRLDEDDLGVTDAWRATQGLTDQPVKQALPGPYTLGRRPTIPAVDRERATLAAADTLGRELRSLAEAGCPLVEVEEPAATRIGTDDAERALFRAAHARLLDHADGVHASLAITGGDATAAGERTFFDLPYASYLFDLIAGPDHWRLIARAPGERGIVVGALDARAEATDEPALLVWALHYAASTGGRGSHRVGVTNAGSLAGLTPDRLARKLQTLGDAARIAAGASIDEIAADLDPRAIDSRTAALGRRVPRPRPRPRTRPDVDRSGTT